MGTHAHAHAAGLHVHQLRPGEKRPLGKAWQNAPRLTDDQVDTLDLRQWGVRLDNLLIVDLDTKRDQDAATADFQQLVADIPAVMGAGLIVESGSRNGARHYYFKLPPSFEGKSGKYGSHIDLLTGAGHQVVGPGSIHPDTGFSYRIISGSFDEIDLAPPALLALIAKPEPRQLPPRTAQPLASEGELGEMLSYVDAEAADDYESWHRIGMALFAASDGQAFDLWCRWSEQSAKYDPAGMPAKWASFATERSDAIGIGTLRWLAVRGGWKARRADDPTPRVLSSPVSLEAAQARLKGVYDRFLAASADHWGSYQAWAGSGQFGPPPRPPAMSVNLTVGGGKTWLLHKALIAADADALIGVPSHRLAKQQRQDLLDSGTYDDRDVEVWRGLGQPDFYAESHLMCRRYSYMKEALSASLAVESVCKICPHNGSAKATAPTCGATYQRKRMGVQVWIVPHALLTDPKLNLPRPVGGERVLIVDEALPARDAVVLDPAEDLGPVAGTFLLDTHERRLLGRHRSQLACVIQATANGEHISREAMLAYGFTADSVAEALALERNTQEIVLATGDLAVDGPRFADARKAHSPKRMKLWQLLLEMLEGEEAASPHVLAHNGRAHMRWQSRLTQGVDKLPVLLLDATAEPVINRLTWPHLREAADLRIEAPHERRVRVTGTAFAKSWQVESETANERTNATRRNNVERLRRTLEHRAALAWPRTVGFIGHLATVEALRGGDLPKNLVTGHLNALRGLNAFEDVAELLVCGRTLPDELTILAMARGRFGTMAPTLEQLHAIRRSICENEITQAIGRGRGVRRGAADPLRVFVMSGVETGEPDHEAIAWDALQPQPLELMAARGLWIDNWKANGFANVLHAVMPDVFETLEAARVYAKRSLGQT